MRIRHLEPARDVETLVSWMPDLYESNFPDFKADVDFLSRQRARLKEASRDPFQVVLVAEGSEGPGGFIWIALERAWSGSRAAEVSAIYVAPHARGQGVGRLLMEEAEVLLRSQGVHTIYLMVTASNVVAHSLYSDLGFRVTRYQMEKKLR